MASDPKERTVAMIRSAMCSITWCRCVSCARCEFATTSKMASDDFTPKGRPRPSEASRCRGASAVFALR